MYAFHNCSSLTEVTIPNRVEEIGESAFAHCISLTEVELPDSVTQIGMYAFYGCGGLAQITIPDSVTQIGMYAFGVPMNWLSVISAPYVVVTSLSVGRLLLESGFPKSKLYYKIECESLSGDQYKPFLVPWSDIKKQEKVEGQVPCDEFYYVVVTNKMKDSLFKQKTGTTTYEEDPVVLEKGFIQLEDNTAVLMYGHDWLQKKPEKPTPMCALGLAVLTFGLMVAMVVTAGIGLLGAACVLAGLTALASLTVASLTVGPAANLTDDESPVLTSIPSQ